MAGGAGALYRSAAWFQIFNAGTSGSCPHVVSPHSAATAKHAAHLSQRVERLRHLEEHEGHDDNVECRRGERKLRGVEDDARAGVSGAPKHAGSPVGGHYQRRWRAAA
jgi:hypothetical protein